MLFKPEQREGGQWGLRKLPLDLLRLSSSQAWGGRLALPLSLEAPLPNCPASS